MKQTVIVSGFRPGPPRPWEGEHIYRIVETRSGGVAHDFHSGAVSGVAGKYYGLDNGAWVKDLGGEKYQTDWTGEERWGRAEERETDETGAVTKAETLGFVLLRVDRSRGLL